MKGARENKQGKPEIRDGVNAAQDCTKKIKKKKTPRCRRHGNDTRHQRQPGLFASPSVDYVRSTHHGRRDDRQDAIECPALRRPGSAGLCASLPRIFF